MNATADAAKVRIEDTFVRGVYVGATHLKRYDRFYAVGAAWVAVIALVSPVRNAVPVVDRAFDDVMAAPAAPDAAKAPFDGDPTGFGAGSGSSDFELTSEAAPGAASGPETARGDHPQGGDDTDEPASGPLPAALDPALAAGGPTLGMACDTFGLAILVATMAAPGSPVPLPLSAADPAVTPVYLTCSQVPRSDSARACETDAAAPTVPGAPVPLRLGASAAVVEQLRVAESRAPAEPGAADRLGGLLGCRPS